MHEPQLWRPSGSVSVVGIASLRRAVEIINSTLLIQA